MPPTIRRALFRLIQSHLPLMPHTEASIKTNLMCLCPQMEREINFILLIFTSDNVNEIVRLGKFMPTIFVLPKLVRRLMRELNIQEAEANWAVNSWAMAFGVIPFTDELLIRI